MCGVTPSTETFFDTHVWGDALYRDLLRWGHRLWEEVHIEGLIQGDISAAAAASLFSSIVRELPIHRVVDAETAEAAVQVSPLGSIKKIETGGPSPVSLRSYSAPIRRIQIKQKKEKGETETEEKETEKETETETEETEIDAEIKGDISAAAAASLFSSIVRELRIHRVVDAETAEAAVQVSPLGSIKKIETGGPSPVSLRWGLG
ncbi:M16 family peptidase, putative [Eimeria mitis]|uniref:M16 family peptidase, putative n=1 Tax=Eimeria mitis TaxID=44415 RepID=U6K499_9EIME|nr:M16 family peptidase, putative [Eimeria mitis]CDJ32504.1 M16 family peptidase, putative [Eimeria mitis]